jgi:hypothetical protein
LFFTWIVIRVDIKSILAQILPSQNFDPKQDLSITL